MMIKRAYSFLDSRSLLGVLTAALTLPLSSGIAQTYEYDDAIQGGLDYYWTDSQRWGLEAPQYPDGADVIAKLLRPSSNRTLRVDGLSLTVGELRIGDGGTGSGRWTIDGSTGNNATITLNKSDGMGVIYSSGGTTSLGSSLHILATGGVEFKGNTALLIKGANTKISGGIKHSSTANVYIYRSTMIENQEVELTAGNINLGTINANYNTFNNNFTLAGNAASFRGIYSNTAGSRLVLSGNITGPASLRLGSDNPATNDETELRGINNYAGSTRIDTHILFHSIENFGQGGIRFTTANRTLTYADDNTADLTTNSQGAERSFELAADTTINTGANDVVFAHAVTGTGRLTKTGAGKLTLNGENAFGGATITEGTLVAGNSQAFGLATAALEIGASARLELLKGVNITVDDLELGSDAILAFHLGQTAARLVVTGDQTGDGVFIVTIDTSEQWEEGSYTLLSIEGNVAAGESAFVLDSASQQHGFLEWQQGSGQLIFHAIPEPSAAVFALLGAGGALCGFWKRGKACAGR